MDKVFTIKYDSNIIDTVSNTISEFISTIEDFCDGVFTVCYERGNSKGKLRNINLCVISSDLDFVKSINGKSIECSVCPITIIGIPSMCFMGMKSDISVDRMLKSGKIILDNTGTLRGIQRNLDSSKSVETLRKRGAIKTKPPIQYVKRA